MKNRLIILMTSLIMLISGTTTASAETRYVNAFSGLNCRQTPSIEADNIITAFEPGTPLDIIGVDETGQWWEVWDGTTQGYCFAQYLSESPEAEEKEEVEVGNCLGTFYITGYTPDPAENGGSGITAMGDNAWDVVDYAIATDPNVIPMNSHVYIEGIGERVARDTGGAIKGNKIDVLVSDINSAYAITGYRKVYIVK